MPINYTQYYFAAYVKRKAAASLMRKIVCLLLISINLTGNTCMHACKTPRLNI